MSKISQSVAWWCFVPARLSPEAFVHAVAEAGYAAIDLVPEAYWPLVTDHGLAISAAVGREGRFSRPPPSAFLRQICTLSRGATLRGPFSGDRAVGHRPGPVVYASSSNDDPM